MKFSIKDFSSKCDQILKKSLMKNFIFLDYFKLSFKSHCLLYFPKTTIF